MVVADTSMEVEMWSLLLPLHLTLLVNPALAILNHVPKDSIASSTRAITFSKKEHVNVKLAILGPEAQGCLLIVHIIMALLTLLWFSTLTTMELAQTLVLVMEVIMAMVAVTTRTILEPLVVRRVALLFPLVLLFVVTSPRLALAFVIPTAQKLAIVAKTMLNIVEC